MEKPIELYRYELVKATGLPVWAGGLQDQPHLWLGQFKVVQDAVSLWNALEKRNQELIAKQKEEEEERNRQKNRQV